MTNVINIKKWLINRANKKNPHTIGKRPGVRSLKSFDYKLHINKTLGDY